MGRGLIGGGGGRGGRWWPVSGVERFCGPLSKFWGEWWSANNKIYKIGSVLHKMVTGQHPNICKWPTLWRNGKENSFN